MKLISTMSQDDVKSFGTSIGMGAEIDNWESIKFNATPNQSATTALAFPGTTATNLAITGLVGGNGLSNNQPYPVVTAGTGDQGDQPLSGNQFYGTYNNAFFSRLANLADVSVASSTTSQNLYGASSNTGATAATIMTSSQLTNEFKNFFPFLTPITVYHITPQ